MVYLSLKVFYNVYSSFLNSLSLYKNVKYCDYLLIAMGHKLVHLKVNLVSLSM
jgi:hypothetical protein